MLMGLTVPKLLLIFAIGLLVFGPGKLPLVGKSLGKSVREFKSAVTDSEAVVRYADGKDGINNLMAIYSCCTGLDYEAIEREFDGKGYGDFKVKVAEAVIEELRPVQENYKRFMADKEYLMQTAAAGAEKAARIANRTLTKAKKKVGLLLG